ncbi:MAG: DegT/DnrJ/EryC1/StrS family aminotransferase [Acidobacteria bacterium]|nr:DegT/DnrJ/EryC1/StrS family aminotransferase [Acidobacteriota bacterium]MCG2812225.1 DegT/DnrJ/EryC1/StrS family aminotransferase [Candidatus Aminicenantes bacterium]
MPRRKNFLVFGSPLIEEAEIAEVVSSLRSGWIGTGPKVHRFEEMFRNFTGSRFAMALNSCTAALHLSMLAIGIKPGDEVIIPALTFAATANAVIHAGGRPVLVDCQRETMNMDPEDAERKITKKTRAIIPVHFAGRPCAMDAIADIARRHRLHVVEDCAHAIETEFQGKKVGTFGAVGCYSFYVTKNIVTGEGGMAVTDNDEYAARIKTLGLHGLSRDAWKRFSDKGYKHYQVVEAGFKYNMMDLQAALGIHQLPRLDRYWQRRQEIWHTYNDAFQDLPVFLPAPLPGDSKHACHLYTLLLDTGRLKISRDQFLEQMTEANIGVGVHYIALHLHPFYQLTYGYKPGDFPNADWISERTVSLPLSPKLSNEDVADVIAAVREILHGHTPAL